MTHALLKAAGLLLAVAMALRLGADLVRPLVMPLGITVFLCLVLASALGLLHRRR